MTYKVVTPCSTHWAGVGICTISILVENDSAEDAVDYAHYLISHFCKGVIPGYGYAEEIKKSEKR